MTTKHGYWTGVDGCKGCGNDEGGCLEGEWYEPCGYEFCYGLCEYEGLCPCLAHDKESE